MARWITPSNGLNQYDAVGGVTLGYDDSGNLTGDGVWTYAYDAENRLVYASDGNSTTTYAYDPKGRRIIKDSSVTGETQYLYEGDEPIADYTGGGSLLRRYAHGATVDERLVFWQYAGTDGSLERQLSYIANHQGSIIGLIDQATAGDYTAGEVTRLTHDAYGVPGQPEDGQPFRYTGRRYDPETGLYYYRARYYSATLGRFLQVDPIGYEDNMNLYGYTANDPVNGTDPTGMYSRGGHNILMAAAYEGFMSPAQLARIQKLGHRFDMNTQAYNSAHSLRDPGQSVQGAITRRNNGMLYHLSAARTAYSAGDQGGFEDYLARAIHPMMDQLSPSHQDENGDPAVYTGLTGQGEGENIVSHVWGERKPSAEATSQSNERLRSALAYARGETNTFSIDMNGATTVLNAETGIATTTQNRAATGTRIRRQVTTCVDKSKCGK